MAELLKWVIDLSGDEPTEELVPLSPAEVKQLEADHADAAARADAAAATQARRDDLLERLTAGTASTADVQAALADVLGASDTGLEPL